MKKRTIENICFFSTKNTYKKLAKQLSTLDTLLHLTIADCTLEIQTLICSL